VAHQTVSPRRVVELLTALLMQHFLSTTSDVADMSLALAARTSGSPLPFSPSPRGPAVLHRLVPWSLDPHLTKSAAFCPLFPCSFPPTCPSGYRQFFSSLTSLVFVRFHPPPFRARVSFQWPPVSLSLFTIFLVWAKKETNTLFVWLPPPAGGPEKKKNRFRPCSRSPRAS